MIALDRAGAVLRGVEGALDLESVDPQVCSARLESVLGMTRLVVAPHAPGTCVLSMVLGDVAGDVRFAVVADAG